MQRLIDNAGLGKFSVFILYIKGYQQKLVALFVAVYTK